MPYAVYVEYQLGITKRILQSKNQTQAPTTKNLTKI